MPKNQQVRERRRIGFSLGSTEDAGRVIKYNAVSRSPCWRIALLAASGLVASGKQVLNKLGRDLRVDLVKLGAAIHMFLDVLGTGEA